MNEAKERVSEVPGDAIAEQNSATRGFGRADRDILADVAERAAQARTAAEAAEKSQMFKGSLRLEPAENSLELTGKTPVPRNRISFAHQCGSRVSTPGR
jgi:hypothetical protein